MNQQTINFPLLALAITGQLADVVSTKIALNLGFHELNPLIGSEPSLSKMLLIKSIVLCLILLLTRESARTYLLIFASVIGFLAAAWNFSLIGKFYG